jgi:hypothetical protein
VASTKSSGLETISYRFEFSNGLTATAVKLRALTTSDTAPVTIVLDSKGKKESAPWVSDRVNRGEVVLATDLLLTGDMTPAPRPAPGGYAQLLATFGERALGVESAQLAAITRWLQRPHVRTVRLETGGVRSQIVALVAAALHPELYSEVVTRGGIPTLDRILDSPLEPREAPELFCMNLYRSIDIDRLIAVAAPARVFNR